MNFSAILASPITTTAGVAKLVLVLYTVWQTRTVNWDELVDALVGIGLVGAKDFYVTGGVKSL